MRIGIVAPTPVPYQPGGAEALWAGLVGHLAEETPHDVELVTLPVPERTLPEVMAAYEAFAGLDVSGFDAVVSGKYPAWMVRHPQHVVYMLHPLRGLYDSYGLFGRPRAVVSGEPEVQHLLATATGVTRQTLPHLFERWHVALGRLGADHPDLAFPGPLARLLVREMDAMALATDQVRRHAAISWTVAGREGYFPRSAAVRVLHPPSDLTGLHTREGEYFFTASRHDAPKRIDLLIRAMAHYPGERRLLIAGAGPETDRLRALAADDPRIELLGRVPQDELVEHYARAVGVPFVPLDEDLGFITYEALASGKPVLTTWDSGGPMEFVEDGSTGVVVDPTPEALGAGLLRLEQLARDPEVATRARRATRAQSWRRVSDGLLETGRRTSGSPRARRGRPRLVVTSTFPVWPAMSGGQLRARHLYGALAETFDIDLVCQSSSAAPPSVDVIVPGLTQHVVPRTPAHESAEAAVTAEAGIPVTDIVAGRLTHLSPAYAQTLAELADGAVGVLLADPFLHPVVAEAVPGLPVVYDAYNCEYVLKAQMLPPGPATDDLLDEVRRVEGDAYAASSLVLTVSAEDRAALIATYGPRDVRFADAPNGTDLEALSFVDPAARERNRRDWVAAFRDRGGSREIERLAVFVGSWHEPNNVAAREIALMAPALPEVAFLLVGSHVGSLGETRLPGNVLPLGQVPDALKRRLLDSADVALAPMTAGSGTNLKVVEYLAAGIPVVSTEIGMRGLALPDDAAEVVPLEAFPAAIRRTLDVVDDGGRAARVAEAVHRAYDWRVIGAGVAPLVLQTVQPDGAAAS